MQKMKLKKLKEPLKSHRFRDILTEISEKKEEEIEMYNEGDSWEFARDSLLRSGNQFCGRCKAPARPSTT